MDACTRLLHGREIETQVDLLIDLLVVEVIGPPIRETRFNLRIAHLRKRFGPHIFGWLFSASDAMHAVFLPQVAVDLQEALQQSSGEPVSTLRSFGVRRDCGDDGIEEPLVDRDLRLDELLDERLMFDRRRDLVAGTSRAYAVMRAVMS